MSAVLDNTLTVLGDWLEHVLPPGFAAVRGQENRVPAPINDMGIMTVLRSSPLASTVHSYRDLIAPMPGSQNIVLSMEVTIQLDLYGPNADGNALTVAVLFRDAQACDWFAAAGGVAAPLHAGEPRQIPYINQQKQYEGNWSLDLHLNVHPSVAVQQAYADQLIIVTRLGGGV